jgi:hypothetical protein
MMRATTLGVAGIGLVAQVSLYFEKVGQFFEYKDVDVSQPLCLAA